MKHEIPQALLDKLESFTYGGYILSFVNKEGETITLNSFNNPTLERGVRSNLESFLSFANQCEEHSVMMFEDDELENQ